MTNIMPPTLEELRAVLRLCDVPPDASDRLEEAIDEQDGSWESAVQELLCESSYTVTADWRYDALEVLYGLERALRLHGIHIHVDEADNGHLFVETVKGGLHQTLAISSEGAGLAEIVSAFESTLPRTVSIMGLTGLDGKDADTYAFIALPIEAVEALKKQLGTYITSIFTSLEARAADAAITDERVHDDNRT